MKVPYVDLAAQYAEEREPLLKAIDQALASGIWVGGKEVDAVEAAIAKHVGVKHAVALNSGTDALIIGLLGAGVRPNDEVVTAPNSFVASAAAIASVGAVPVFADVGYDELLDADAFEAAITPRTTAVMPIHLRGSVCDMERILAIAKRRKLLVIEDAAQSFGSMRFGVQAGAFGDVGCISLHPLKALNACGDGGMLVTNSDSIAQFARLFRNHGLKDRDTVTLRGTVSRLDTLQAAIVMDRMGRLADVFARRRRNAAIYHRFLAPRNLRLTTERSGEFHTFNTFVLQTNLRDELQLHLTNKGVGSAVHYRIPLHLQPALAHLGYRADQFPVTEKIAQTMLSVPVHQCHSEGNIEHVAASIVEFLDRK